MLKEFRPALLFLLKFGLIFGVLSGIYSYWIKSYEGEPDPITQVVSDHTVGLLRIAGFAASQEPTVQESSTTLFIHDRAAVRVFEGCNGVAVFILFIAFLFAFRIRARTVVFALVGGIIIHLFNLLRIAGLAWIAVFRPEYMYFTHKYLFTLILYAVVFILWILFVRHWTYNLRKST